MFSLVMDYLVGTLQGIALVGIITVLTVVIFFIVKNEVNSPVGRHNMTTETTAEEEQTSAAAAGGWSAARPLPDRWAHRSPPPLPRLRVPRRGEHRPRLCAQHFLTLNFSVFHVQQRYRSPAHPTTHPYPPDPHSATPPLRRRHPLPLSGPLSRHPLPRTEDTVQSLMS